MKKILITGANFCNKGAQAMLFVTVDEIKKRIPDADIYFTTWEKNIDFNNLKIKAIFYNEEAMKIALHEYTPWVIFVRLLKNFAKLIKQDDIVSIRDFFQLRNVISEISIIIDISGYNLGAKWGISSSENFLNYIRLAKINRIPIYIMPQSFGPFNYSKGKERIMVEMKDLLRYPKIIYARENEGYRLLCDELGLNNVKKSTDLVLQNDGIDWSNIFKQMKNIEIPNIDKGKSVAIVPNLQCFIHGTRQVLLDLYSRIINILVDKGFNVYIFRHADDDLNLCKELYNLNRDKEKLKFLDKSFSCFEYDAFIKKFDFAICSRFHGVVHAYKNYIPCIVLGWAVKYFDLAKAVGQEDYCFDISELDSDNQCEISKICNSIEKMSEYYSEQRNVIQKHMIEIRKQNCFDIFGNIKLNI